METQTKTEGGGAKDFFLNLAAIVALYTVVVSLVNLLFTVINRAYPQINQGFYSSTSISWPVAILVIFFPIFIVIMYFLGKQYEIEPERRYAGIHKWLTYITLFIAGLAMAIDLITVLYFFIDGQELTTGFILKALALLIVACSLFTYYLADLRGKLTPNLRQLWRIVSTAAIIGSIVWGFAVLGSPRTQRLFKYDEQRVSDISNLYNLVENYYDEKGSLPVILADVTALNYGMVFADPQTGKSYVYQKKTNTTYNLCAEFSKESPEATASNKYAHPIGYPSWTHPAGEYCFELTINPNIYSKPVPMR